jgi:rubrerythrin
MNFASIKLKSIVASLGLLTSMVCIPAASASTDEQAQGEATDQYLQALKAINEKRHLDAKALLEKLVASEPQHAGALLDLAIMQCNLGNRFEAERLFTFMINRFAPPPAILEIIEIHRKTGCIVKAPDVAINFSVERGYDTNANQGAMNSIFTIDDFGTPINLQLLPEYLPKPDNYVSTSLDLSQETPAGNTFYIQLRGRQFSKLSNFNSAGVATGIESQFRINDWTIHPSASLNILSLANALYQKQVTGRIKLDVPTSTSSLKYSIVSSVARIAYPTIKDFDGSQFELRVLGTKQADRYFFNINAGLMYDDGNQRRLGGDRRGWTIGGFVRSATPLQIYGKPIFAEFGVQHQSWQNSKIYLAGLINVKKHQNNNTLRAALGWAINPNNTVQLEYRQIANRENVSFLSFDSRQLQLSWQWQQ